METVVQTSIGQGKTQFDRPRPSADSCVSEGLSLTLFYTAPSVVYALAEELVTKAMRVLRLHYIPPTLNTEPQLPLLDN
ncbi:hypothetical protein BDV38DRAFT_244053 [Aspergillus pseudotamarii]|uniref:Uncharacterized protein n=1 Tax=Aspergillus pseudotamarii TaxID=132259 RepID=A0A5N6SYP6_ASPPS|nr:uncharacterized protein BDV38DRAFT_244053 [Aspergillus pseudotamarii]KAE8138880.1 hypothetical protein BDV38DRAFT_244053 [Aspergillus pseudotamarii]